MKMEKAGRPSKYNPEKHLDETLKLSALGVNEEDIAWFFGVHPNTFANWKKEHEELLWALKEGQSHKKISLMKAMFFNATKRHHASVQIFLAKNWLGMTDKQEVDSNVSGGLKIEIEKIITDQRPDE